MLGSEALVLLLAIQPIRLLGGDLSGAAIGLVVVMAVVVGVIAALLRRGWAWHAGSAAQVVLVAGGLLHWSIAVLGILGGLAWTYALYIRRRVLG